MNGANSPNPSPSMATQPCRTCGSTIYFVDIGRKSVPHNAHYNKVHLLREKCVRCGVGIKVHVKSDGTFSPMRKRKAGGTAMSTFLRRSPLNLFPITRGVMPRQGSGKGFLRCSEGFSGEGWQNAGDVPSSAYFVLPFPASTR